MAVSLVGSAFAEDTSVASTTQSAANVAQVTQTGSTSSGDAVAFPGAKATTGNVKVEATVEVSQKSEQEADTSATGGSVATTDQAARNTANVSQDVAVASGSAIADGSQAQASTGDVNANVEVDKYQKIEQKAETEASASVYFVPTVASTSQPAPVSVAPGLATTTQSATNTDIVLQAVIAQSGDAVASGSGAKAKSGDVYEEAKVKDSQKIEQNDGRRGGESETWGGVAVIEQTASQTNNAVQGVVAASGNAVASVTSEDEEVDGVSSLAVGFFPFFCDLAVAETGDVDVEAEIEQEQKIEQDADAYAALYYDEEGDAPLAAIFQAAYNTSIAYQFAVAFSGDASAFATFGQEEDTVDANGAIPFFFWGTKASTGDVYAKFKIDNDQDIDQEADATAIGSGSIAIVDQDVDADAANYAALIQGTIDGTPILVYSGNAAAFGADWEGSWAWSGDVGTCRHPAQYKLDLEQEIEQEACTFAGSGVYFI